ncbi:chromatin assembly factor 1 subunit A-like [Seriola lalandi dorsalis]|uniref:chromatin assembly factor 1 subunit A-like n=1 Tax=Seriola lalandi dorsalis TaxID=1841481 RepID=UPI000C6F8ED7|nr:chromatin assembly factor 1 subunit A-like [Seriola lalandi dorsalis]
MPPLKEKTMANNILDQSSFTSSPCFTMGMVCGFGALAFGGLILLIVVCKCKRDKSVLQEFKSLKIDERDKMAQLVTTLREQKRELENQRDKHKRQLEKIQKKKEDNKEKLLSVERKITEKKMSFDKTEALLREKENLLHAEWRLDDTKKTCKRQLLNIEKLLEPIENLNIRIE